MTGCAAILFFGPPAVVLAAALTIAGTHRQKPFWLLGGALLLAPFSFYLGQTPLARYWAFALPVLPLIGAAALRCGRPRVARVTTYALIVVLLALLGMITLGRATSPSA